MYYFNVLGEFEYSKYSNGIRLDSYSITLTLHFKLLMFSGASLKIDQLLKHFEFLTSPLAQIVEIMAVEHSCKSTVSDIIRSVVRFDHGNYYSLSFLFL